MKHFFIAVQAKQEKKSIFNISSGPIEYGYYAMTMRFSENDNIFSMLSGIGGIVSANIMPTKQEADRIVSEWNKEYKEQGIYFFN